MKAYISKTSVLAGVALSALISASLYFVSPEFPAPSSHDPSTLSGTASNTAVEGSSAREVPISNLQGAVSLDNNTVRTTQQDDALSDSDKDFSMLEKSNQVQLTRRDLELPPPSGKNVMSEATGEYADQINQQIVLHNAKSEGYPPPEAAPGSHPPSGQNIAADPQGENAHEISQQALIDKAKSEGYLPPEVAPDSHPPSGKNVTSEPQGENVQEISQHALIDKAKSEGYLLH